MYWLITNKSNYFDTLDECLEYLNDKQVHKFAIYKAVDYGWRLVGSG